MKCVRKTVKKGVSIALGVAALGMSLIAGFTVGLVTGIAGASPNPLDPHVPNIQMGNCQGGRGGFIIFWCDGERFADGSYWHQLTSNYGPGGTMDCVVENPEGVGTLPAPPGGCDGAV